MRRLAAIAVLLTVPGVVRAVIVDRVAIAVGNKVITQSDIDQRIRLTAFQNGETPDFSLATRRAAARRLIDQRLIQREMDVGRFPPTTADHGRELLSDYQQSHYPVGRTAMLNALKADGLTESDLEEDLMRESDLLTFLNLRFRPAVQVADGEVQKYFDEEVPAGPYKEQGLNAMRPQIEGILATQRADQDLDAWLKEQRERLKIEYVDKDLEEAPPK